MTRGRRILLQVVAGVVLATGAVQAGERAFAYSYGTLVMPKGIWEYEQQVTWKHDKHDKDSSYNRFDVRHELEYGITDRLQAALYFDWRYTGGESVSNDRARFRDVALEVVYQLTNPNVDAFGSALYGEVKWGDEVFELEGKLLLQKNIGDWTLAWNGKAAAEWESKDYNEDKGEFGQTAGISYWLSDRVSLGVEAVHEWELKNWEASGEHVVYAGPSLSVRMLGGFITVSPLMQVTDVVGEADYQTRLIAAFDF